PAKPRNKKSTPIAIDRLPNVAATTSPIRAHPCDPWFSTATAQSTEHLHHSRNRLFDFLVGRIRAEAEAQSAVDDGVRQVHGEQGGRGFARAARTRRSCGAGDAVHVECHEKRLAIEPRERNAARVWQSRRVLANDHRRRIRRSYRLFKPFPLSL